MPQRSTNDDQYCCSMSAYMKPHRDESKVDERQKWAVNACHQGIVLDRLPDVQLRRVLGL